MPKDVVWEEFVKHFGIRWPDFDSAGYDSWTKPELQCALDIDTEMASVYPNYPVAGIFKRKNIEVSYYHENRTGFTKGWDFVNDYVIPEANKRLREGYYDGN